MSHAARPPPALAGNLLGVLFFGAIFFLGIDSAFALVEGE